MDFRQAGDVTTQVELMPDQVELVVKQIKGNGFDDLTLGIFNRARCSSKSLPPAFRRDILVAGGEVLMRSNETPVFSSAAFDRDVLQDTGLQLMQIYNSGFEDPARVTTLQAVCAFLKASNGEDTDAYKQARAILDYMGPTRLQRVMTSLRQLMPGRKPTPV